MCDVYRFCVTVGVRVRVRVCVVCCVLCVVCCVCVLCAVVVVVGVVGVVSVVAAVALQLAQCSGLWIEDLGPGFWTWNWDLTWA